MSLVEFSDYMQQGINLAKLIESMLEVIDISNDEEFTEVYQAVLKAATHMPGDIAAPCIRWRHSLDQHHADMGHNPRDAWWSPNH